MASVFTKIINREIPGYIFYEDEKFIAILDINPIRDGHVLVIPKKEIDYIFDLDDQEYLELMSVSKKMAHLLEEKLKDKVNYKRIAMLLDGSTVPHVHVHLIPVLVEDLEGLQIERSQKIKYSLVDMKSFLLN